MFENTMFARNLLNRLSDEVPADFKEKAIESVTSLTQELRGASHEAVEPSAEPDDATADFIIEQPQASENVKNSN